MSGKSSTAEVLRKWQAAADWQATARNVVKHASKLSEMMNGFTEESDSLSEELLRLHKSLASTDDVEVIDCSLMALRNNVKSFVFFQRAMMTKIIEHFDVPSYSQELVDITDKKKNFLKALTEYDATVEKTQEAIKKKKMDEKMFMDHGKELDRLNIIVETNKLDLERRLNSHLNQHSTVYARCILQLMDRQHEFFKQGWEVVKGLEPKLCLLEERLSRQDDGSKEGYLMKKSGFSWVRCYVSLRGSKLSWQSKESQEPKYIDVKLCTTRLRPNAGEFEVVSPSKERPLVLQADTETERSTWLEALQQAIALGLQGPSKPSAQQLQQNNLMLILQSVEGNLVCADCAAPEPDWASINLGILLCLECSGVHRSMGTHISKVRSINLDVWDPETILLSQRIGNTCSNKFFEAAPSNDIAPKPFGRADRETRIKYIQAKYKDLRFVDDFRRGWETQELVDALSAVNMDNVHDIIRLIALGASPNALPSSTIPPVITATINNNVFALEALVQNGADAFSTDMQGWTALHHAAALNLVQCGALLLRRGFGDKSASAAEIRMAAYHIAVKHNADNMSRLLKEEGWASHIARQMLKDSAGSLSPALATTPVRSRSLIYSLSNSADGLRLDPDAPVSPSSAAPAKSTRHPSLETPPRDSPNKVDSSPLRYSSPPQPKGNPERHLVIISGLIVQTVSKMKAKMMQNAKLSPDAYAGIDIAVNRLESFFHEYKIPPPEVPVSSQLSHPHLQLNKMLAYVSMICKAYQLAPSQPTAHAYNELLKEIHQLFIGNET